MKRTVFATLILFGTLSATSAFAGDRCDVPSSDWQPADALQQKLEADGWEVKRIKTEDGCYEAYALDKDGRKVEAYFDPKTFEQVGDEDDEG
jgi:hypothetical protein